MQKMNVDFVKRDVETVYAGKVAMCVISGQDDEAWFNGAAPGEILRIRVRSDEVSGRCTIIESIVQPMVGPPLHTHLEDEIFSILEGTLTFEAAGKRIEAGPGTIVTIPAGVQHAWRNFSDEPVRFLATFTPGGIEELFELLQFTPPQFLAEVAARYGSIILGPPIER